MILCIGGRAECSLILCSLSCNVKKTSSQNVTKLDSVWMRIEFAFTRCASNANWIHIDRVHTAKILKPKLLLVCHTHCSPSNDFYPSLVHPQALYTASQEIRGAGRRKRKRACTVRTVRACANNPWNVGDRILIVYVCYTWRHVIIKSMLLQTLHQSSMRCRGSPALL